MTFNDRTAVITGAAGRIGRATARQLAEHGVKLYLTDLNMEKLETVVADLRQIHPEIYPVYMDVSVPENIEQASQMILQRAGRVDILVNNAGCWPPGSALETSVENFKSVIELNLYSVFHLSKIFGEKMKAQQYGRIINLGSIAGEVGLPCPVFVPIQPPKPV